MIVSEGIISRQPRNRGTTRYWIGFAPIDVSASICSVTRIVPSSAAIALPTRPASIVAASTGPSSRHIDRLISAPSRVSKPNCFELRVRLHRQHHADERAGERDDRQAQHANVVERRDERVAAGHARDQPRQRCAT